jgi:hypothetical protein
MPSETMTLLAHPDPDYDRQMTQKELADWARRCRQWIGKCGERGFIMVGGTASPRQLQSWLVRNPAPYSKEWDQFKEAA